MSDLVNELVNEFWDAKDQRWIRQSTVTLMDFAVDPFPKRGPTYVSDLLDMTFSPPGLSLAEMMAGSWYHSVNRDLTGTTRYDARGLDRLVQDFMQALILSLDNGPSQSAEDALVTKFQRARNWQALPGDLETVMRAFGALGFQNVILPVRLTDALPEVQSGRALMEKVFKHPRILIVYCK
jgi:hypothetical protein